MNFFAWILICLGYFFVMLAGIGLVRMPTFFVRIQAVGKASTFGTILNLVGMSLLLSDGMISLKAFIIIFFLLLSTPIATHAIVKAARKAKYE